MKRRGMSVSIWSRFPCSLCDLQLNLVLPAGQSFRWTKLGEEWTGVIGKQIWKLRQTEDLLGYQTFPVPSDSSGALDVSSTAARTLTEYFALEKSLSPLYASWSAADSRFAEVALRFPGIRVLRQEFLENLFSFICSSNNNIQRIQQMVEKLCTRYGKIIDCVDGKTFCMFPEMEALGNPNIEQELRELGFGYRAGFIAKSARYILDNPDWLDRVKSSDYVEAKKLLMELPGVGAKVADCVCLMSLGHYGAVPVDTHVFSITAQHYLPHLDKCKSVTPRVYQEIGDFYRSRFGIMAGWAHSVLFTADLTRFREPKKNLTAKESKPNKIKTE